MKGYFEAAAVETGTMNIGVIGYGGRTRGLLRLIDRFKTGAVVAAIADPNFEAVKEQAAQQGFDVHDCPVFADPDEMLDGVKLDGVIVGTRCSLHARMGIKVIERGLPLFLEKPVATNREDLLALAKAGRKAKSGVVVSFPLRLTVQVVTVMEMLAQEKIGRLEAVNAWCDPPYADVYFTRWYRDEEETGGLWLQKATHDFDYIGHVVGSPARQVAAMTTRRVFKGDRPAGLRCADCDEWETCMESPFNRYYVPVSYTHLTLPTKRIV